MRLWHSQIKIKTPSLAGRTTKRFQSPAFKHHPPEKICVSLIHEVSFTFVFHEELNRVKLHTTQWSVPKLLGEPLTRWVWNYGIGVFNTDVVIRLRELIKVLKHTGDVDMSIFSYKPWVRKFLWREVIYHWLNNQADQAENSYEDDHMIARIAPAVVKTRAKETILTITLETRLQDLNGSL